MLALSTAEKSKVNSSQPLAIVLVTSTSVLISGFVKFSNFILTTIPALGDHALSLIFFNVEKSIGAPNSIKEPAQTSEPALLFNLATFALGFSSFTPGLLATTVFAPAKLLNA
ncbi:hypothetical protein D3C85_1151760 [compost metagenome]